MVREEVAGGGSSTRERLLEAAARLFAEHGREGVSIRDIAAAAGVRHGGINYHFRSKDELYHEVLMRFCSPGGRERLREMPADLDEEGARALFARVVRDIVEEEMKPLDPIATGLLRAEISRPEGPDDLLFERVIRPNQQALSALIGRMFPQLDERERLVAAFNVASQCIFLRMARPVVLKLCGVEEFDEELTALVANRIVETALRGLGTSVEGRS